MEKHLLSKSTFIRSVQCLKSLYLHKRRPFLRDHLSAEQLAKFKRGTDVGILAQQLFPGGADLQPKSPTQYRKSIAATAEQVSSNADFTIYEASFQSNQILIILDILEKKDGKVYAYEVKSSKAISETYLKDAALQYYVIENSGTAIEDFFIVYINKDYEFGGNKNELDLNQFFKIESVLDIIKELQAFIKNHIPKAKEALTLKHSPEINIGTQCHNPYPCDFRRHCWKHLPKESIFDLSFLTAEQKFELHSKGIFEIAEVENHLDLSKIEKIKLNCHLNQTTFFNEEKIKLFLKPIDYPINFIQFSNVSFAVPRWKNTSPFEMVPLHISVTTLFADQQQKTNSFTVEPNSNSPKEEIYNKLKASLKLNSCIVAYDQLEVLENSPSISESFNIIDFNDLFKTDSIYQPGLTQQSTLQEINTKLLKGKKNPKHLSRLQTHQKLNFYLESNDDERKAIEIELNESAISCNQIQIELLNYLKNLIK